MLKEIKEYKDYYVNEEGEIFSLKSGKMKKRKPWKDSKGRYLIVNLSKDGKVSKKLVHRIAAETFLPNPENLNCVNHIDANPANNNVKNLEWCTTKENIHKSYLTSGMNQKRNEVKVNLFYNNLYIKTFDNIKDACEYASETYDDVSYSGLNRNHKSGKAFIEKV